MSIFNFVDFSGGYANTIPTENMRDNELLVGQNAWWRNGLVKRNGISRYATITASNLRGYVRVLIEGAWRTLLAVDTGAAVELHIGTTTAFTTMTYPGGTTHTLTTGNNVEFAVLSEKVAVVNGVDKPRIAYASNSTVAFDTIERYDTRDIDDDYWFAGAYSSGTASGNYGTNTSAAQSSASTDFQVSPASAGAGFWVANDQTFNQLKVKDSMADASLTFEYQYYGRASAGGATGWITATMVDTPTWTAVGTKTIEWDFPHDPTTGAIMMDPVGASLSAPLQGRYAMRAHNTNTAATSPDAQGLSVHHTQYLGQLLLNDRPSVVAEHKSHIILGSGNWIRMSPRGSMKGWRYRDFQPFEEGGSIKTMTPHLDYLAILLDKALYGLLGNSFADWSVRYLAAVGTTSKRATVNYKDVLYFVGSNGNIHSWDGRQTRVLSKHIREDLRGYTYSNACAAEIQEHIWVAFPSNAIVVVFDPDTLREDEVGDSRVSMYKWTNYRVDQFQQNFGANDNGLVLGLDNTNVQIVRLNHQQWDETTSTVTIDMQIQTRYFDFDKIGQNKIYRRARLRVADTSATSSYNVQFYRQDKFGDASSSAVTVTPSVASGIHTEYLSPPPAFSGESLGLFVRHQYQTNAKLLGISMEVEDRQY